MVFLYGLLLVASFAYADPSHTFDYSSNDVAATFRSARGMHRFDLLGFKGKLLQWYYAYNLSSIKQSLNAENSHRDERAQVRKGDDLAAFELQFRAQRMPYVQQGIEKFLGSSFDETLPVIGFAGSGGGYRAMILTSGYAKALEDVGLLDAVMYMTSLSGSTWFLAPWIHCGSSVRDYQERIEQKITSNVFEINPHFLVSTVGSMRWLDDIIWPKFVFDQTMSSVDLYGAMLARIFFSDFTDRYYCQHLSDQKQKVADGTKPFPMYAAISADLGKTTQASNAYNWYEFNPHEIRNLDYEISIPTWSFNNVFNDGFSSSIDPEQSFGFLLGIFGAAYDVNFDDLNAIVQTLPQNPPSWFYLWERLKYEIIMRVIPLLSAVPTLDKQRLLPAEVNNPFKNMHDDAVPGWLAQQEELSFFDAGIHYNIPLRPLYKKERKVSLIIIGESSGDAVGNTLVPSELNKAFKEIYECYHYAYTRIDDGATNTVHCYKDLEHPDAPRIIYITYEHDEVLLQNGMQDPELRALIEQHDLLNFDAVHCLKDHCGTFQFDYTVEEFRQLAAVGEFNVKANKKVIANFIRQECCNA